MRLDALGKILRRRRLDRLLVRVPANVRAFAGLDCDNAVLSVTRDAVVLHTDFRYVPMVHRLAPTLACRDLKRLWPADAARRFRRVGFESSLPHAQVLAWQRRLPRAKWVDVAADLARVRAVKTADEIAAVRAAERLDCEIWREASGRFSAGMTERQMAKVIRQLMIDRGEGEAFETIVCVGANAAECHHVPDDTVWDGRAPVLVDMGVKLGGVCSDLTRNLRPKRPSRAYRTVYELVRKANLAAIAAARPGMSLRALDEVARKVIRQGGFGRCFGHSLGHGVGYEIHEAPFASRKSREILRPGMLVTIEPGIYLEGNLGVRIEDLVLITEDGCEVLSSAEK